jgi:hypothetical protein
MATTMYAQPAAANFYAPNAHYARKGRGYRLCDQCQAVENPAVAKFRLCGGCMVTQYCVSAHRPACLLRLAHHIRLAQNSECQKAHWMAHKTVCQHTAAQLAAAKEPGSHGSDDLARQLRKFTSAHESLLNWAGFQALRLKAAPANVRQQAVLVELEYNPAAPDTLHRSVPALLLHRIAAYRPAASAWDACL